MVGALTVGSETSMATTPLVRAAMNSHCLPSKAPVDMAPELPAVKLVVAGVAALVVTATRSCRNRPSTSAAVMPFSRGELPTVSYEEMQLRKSTVPAVNGSTETHSGIGAVGESALLPSKMLSVKSMESAAKSASGLEELSLVASAD